MAATGRAVRQRDDPAPSVHPPRARIVASSPLPNQLGHVLTALGIPSEFIDRELLAMENCAWSKTANRSVTRSMNDFTLLADHRRHDGEAEDLIALSASPAHTPCSSLCESHVRPDEEVRALANDQSS